MTSLPLARVFHGFLIALIGGNLTAQSTGSLGGIGGGIQIPERDVVTSSRIRQSAP